MTRNQYDRGLGAVMAKYERLPRTLTETDMSNLNGELAAFKKTAVIVETTAPTRPASRPAASKAAKPSKRERRITRIVREILTAPSAPRPALGTGAAAKPKATAPAKPLHELDPDQLGVMASERLGAGAASPFWRPRESAPAASITESTAPTDRDLADLAKLGNDELDGVLERAAARTPRCRGCGPS
jgi:hypothetical protein